MSASDFELQPIGSIITLTMPTGKVGSYVYLGTDGNLTTAAVPGTNPLYIKLSDTTGILLDNGQTGDDEDDSQVGWKYSFYLLEDNPTIKRQILRLHLKEVIDLISSPITQTIDGLSYSKSDLQNYANRLKRELTELETALGLNRRTSCNFVRPRLGGF